MPTHKTRTGREVVLTSHMEDALVTAVQDKFKVVRGRGSVVQSLINRGLAQYVASWPTLTEDGMVIADAIEASRPAPQAVHLIGSPCSKPGLWQGNRAKVTCPDCLLEGEPIKRTAPEYRPHPAISAQDRVADARNELRRALEATADRVEALVLALRDADQ